MNIETALKMAIDCETRVRDVYSEAVGKIQDAKGKQVFKVLSDEEQGHLDYLRVHLQKWVETGQLSVDRLETVVPAKERIEEEIGRLKAGLAAMDQTNELQMLNQVLEVETETFRFYTKMLGEVPVEGRALFRRFAEIEEGHVTIVKAEIDFLVRTGYWFDFMEYDMDGAE